MKPWTITWGEITFCDEDLTGADGALLDVFIADGLAGSVDPWRGWKHLTSIITVGVALRSGRTVEDVAEEVGAAPLAALAAALSPRPVEPVEF